MPPKIAVVTTWFPSDEKPAEAPFNLQHARAVDGFADVVVLHVRLGSTEEPRTEDYGGLRVRRLPLGPRRPLASLRTLRALARATRAADFVHTMAFSSVLVLSAARPFARLRWLHTEHWSGITDPSSVSGPWPRLAWLRRALRRPTIVTAVSGPLAEAMEPFTRRPVQLVPCVVENTRPLVPRPGSGIQLIGVGYLVAGKRPEFAVDVVAELVRRGVDARMTWVGGGPLEAAVRERIHAAGLEDRFHLTGMVAPDDVLGYFDSADLFFVPTVRENFFVSAAESVTTGRPVVVAPVGGFTDYLDETNSVLADDSVSGYADAIVTASERFAGVSEASIAEPLRARFSLAAVGRRFGELFDEVAAAQPDGSRNDSA